MRVREWDVVTHGEITEDAIRRMFGSAECYRISTRTYPSKTHFNGVMRSATCYVLAGTGRYRFSDDEAVLNAGQFSVLPDGEYLFEVLSDEEFRSVLVWDLRPLQN